MKNIILAFIVISLGLPALAQDDEYRDRNRDEFKTIFGGKTIGGYGGLGAGYTLINNRPAICFDARGGIILGHSFALGIGGSSFINTPQYITALNTDVSLTGGYGGLFGEIILLPKKKIHLSFPVLIGLGAISATSLISNGTDYYSSIEETSVYMVAEPAVELEFNLTRFFRMAGYFSYRYTSNIDMDRIYASSDALTSYSAGVRIKFGKF
jgi:hypothetical protein